MAKIREKIRGRIRKLRSEAGFSLTEMLATTLIMSMVAAITAAGIPTAKTAYEKTILTANAEILLSTVVTGLTDELGTAWDVHDDGAGRIIYYSADTGAGTQLRYNETTHAIEKLDYAPIEGVTPTSIINPVSNAEHAGLSWQPMVTDAASAKKLYAKYDSATVTKGKVTITGLAVCKKDSDTIMAKYGNKDEIDLIIETETAPGVPAEQTEDGGEG